MSEHAHRHVLGAGAWLVVGNPVVAGKDPHGDAVDAVSVEEAVLDTDGHGQDLEHGAGLVGGGHGLERECVRACVGQVRELGQGRRACGVYLASLGVCHHDRARVRVVVIDGLGDDLLGLLLDVDVNGEDQVLAALFASVICEVPPAMGVPVRPVSTIIWPSVPERTSL